MTGCYEGAVKVQHIPTGVAVAVHSGVRRLVYQRKAAALRVITVRLQAARLVGPPQLVRDYDEQGWDAPEEHYLGGP